jgi:hypothetical protein
VKAACALQNVIIDKEGVERHFKDVLKIVLKEENSLCCRHLVSIATSWQKQYFLTDTPPPVLQRLLFRSNIHF